jgi:hypothetical protein
LKNPGEQSPEVDDLDKQFHYDAFAFNVLNNDSMDHDISFTESSKHETIGSTNSDTMSSSSKSFHNTSF